MTGSGERSATHPDLDDRALKKALDLVATWTAAREASFDRGGTASKISRIASSAQQEFAAKGADADLPSVTRAEALGAVKAVANAEKAVRKAKLALQRLSDNARQLLYGGLLSPTDKFGNSEQVLNPDDCDRHLAALEAMLADLAEPCKAAQPYLNRYRKGGPLHNRAGAPVHMPAQGLIVDCIELLGDLDLADVVEERPKGRLRDFVRAVAEVAGVRVSERQLRTENIERLLLMIGGHET